ncbi:glycosyltransferase family 2 protein [Gelidibacter japonicus]|uniref:glycosyltransferase family 2 protein n=1 Tax=Gelidibacter japonicus TaxID=1962232 RepID=UPI0013D3DAB2|nr:glycosyltransferase family 2 protein [Gelidibacter japonicus]
MKFSLIICTYMRPKALLNLLNSVNKQTLYPNEILIIDGSTNSETEQNLKQHPFKNLVYHKVDDEHRGLTKQRNYGISKVHQNSEAICFLDDDTVLNVNYFKQLLSTYDQYPNALGVGGYISNEVHWQKADGSINSKRFYYDGWMRNEPLRFRIRHWFGLGPDTPPCVLPSFSHGRSVGFLPPSGKIYPVEHFMGGVSSYKMSVFKDLRFSTYFEGYGLYEDVDFCLRLTKRGLLYINTAAQLAHYHEPFGRPNKYKYGKMVIRNGWYVWRVKYPKPNLKMKLKWYSVHLLLISMRLLNIFTTNRPKEAFNDIIGRLVGCWSLLYNKPLIED